jgi:membrane-bound lytic murein transglycosylase D
MNSTDFNKQSAAFCTPSCNSGTYWDLQPWTMTRRHLTWLPLLVLAAVVMTVQPVSRNHGNGLYPLINATQVSDGKNHDNPYPSPAATEAWLPERHTIAETPAGNLWTGLRSGFALPAGRSGPVQAQLDRFARNPGNVERIMQRGTPYLYHILSEINQRGLPTELALLPAVESAFDPFAQSPRGAAGLWQFMPRTASGLGLKQDAWYDGRRDVIAATAAALDYLTQLQQRFDGDWLLALAAYNAGPTRVQRAIRYNRKHGKPVDFWHLQLPRETRDYVPRLLALRTLITTPAIYGLTLPAVVDSPYFSVLDSGGSLDLAVAARLAGVSVDEIRRLNPALTRQTVRRGDSDRLLIPATRAATFRTQLAGLAEQQRVHWVRHHIRAGDTLSSIARRYRIGVARLREFNQLAGSGIMAGDLLIVPVVRG